MADLDDYAKADDATEFGYLHGTTGKPVVGKPHHACHSDVAKTMGYKETDDHTADQTAQKAGHVRYAIAPNGKAAFTYHSNTNPEAHKHIAKFVQKNPHIFNKVAVERMDKDSTGLTQSHMYDFKDSRDTANTLKNLVKEQSYTTFLNKLLREHDEEDHEYKGWISPNGNVTHVPNSGEHRSYPPKGFHSSGLFQDVEGIQKKGHVRFGKSKDSIHGNVHFIHYDAAHPKGHETALKALQYMKPRHHEPVLIMHRPGSGGFLNQYDRKGLSPEQMAPYGKELPASKAHQLLRDRIANRPAPIVRKKAKPEMSDDELLKALRERELDIDNDSVEEQDLVPTIGVDDRLFAEDDVELDNERKVPADFE